MAESIAKGAALTPETYADFVDRLRYHCKGEGVNDHCTADAIFIVQRRVIDYGFDEDYSGGNIAVISPDSDCAWHSLEEFWASCDRSDKAYINNAARKEFEAKFSSLDCDDRIHVLQELDYGVTGWNERWDYVNSHFTKEAAEAWIKRKGHDYPDGLRVMVDAQTYCWEWNAIKEAIMDGRLILKEQGGAE
jgi:hypothetical protein